MIKYILTAVVTLATISISAQELPERGLTRRGNKAYNKSEYKSAIESYDKAYQLTPELFDTQYNYANALQKDEQYTKAEEMYTAVDVENLESDADRADLFYNLGNSQFKQQKYKEALESYKSSIRLNPTDQEAKYNYAYTKKLLDDQQNQEQNQDQNQDQQNQDQDKQNQDQNQNGDDKQDQQNQDQNQDQQDQNQGDDKQQESQSQPSEGKISPQEQQQMLDAIQAQEDKTQEKLDKKEGKGVIVRGKKNW